MTGEEGAIAARIEREAGDWLARLRAGDVGAQSEFEAWFAADPAHAEAYERLLATWDTSAQAAQLDRARLERPAMAPRRWWALAAACALALIGLSWLGIEHAGGSGDEPRLASIVSSPETSHRRFALADGSRVTLDAASAVDVGLYSRERHVQLLRGRARFAVQGDATRPFVVKTEAGTIRAVGTTFDVAAGPSGTRIALLSGKLAVTCRSDPARTYHLVAGQSLFVPTRGLPNTVGTVAPDEGEWVQGVRRFAGTRLAEVVAAVNRQGGIQLSIADPRIAELRFTGSLKVADGAATGRLLARTFGLRLRRHGTSALLLER